MMPTVQLPGQHRRLTIDSEMLLTNTNRPLQSMMLSLRITANQNYFADGLKT